MRDRSIYLFHKTTFLLTFEFSGRKKHSFLTIRWNDLLRVLPMISVAYRGNKLYALSENGEAVTQEWLTTLGCKPMPIEFSAMKKIIAYATDINKKFVGVGVGFRH